MSGRSSRSTLIATNRSFTSCATSGSSYDSRSITWHQWHHTAPMSSRIGLFSRLASSNASSPHSCQRIGWCMAERRYEEEALERELRVSTLMGQVYTQGAVGDLWFVSGY